MLKRVAGVLAVVLLAAVAVYATDPWKDKDFTSWDEKDVQRILQDSPWSHKVQYGMNAGGGMEGNLTAGGEAASHGDPNASPTTTTLNSRSRNSSGGAGAPNAGAETVFVVSWFSSNTIREAEARRKELAGTSADEARKGLSTPSDTYQTMVISQNMRAFARATEDDLKAQAYLILKSTKAKIAPSRVAIQKGQTGMPVALFFIFDKKTATGEPTFAPDEKGVEFSFQAVKTTLKITFDFTKMQNKQGLDI